MRPGQKQGGLSVKKPATLRSLLATFWDKTSGLWFSIGFFAYVILAVSLVESW